MKDNNKMYFVYWGLTALVVILACITTAFIFINWNTFTGKIHSLISILLPFILGLVLAYLFAPLYDAVDRICTKKMTENKKMQHFQKMAAKTIASLVCLAALLGTLTGMIILILPNVYSSILTVINKIPGSFAEMEELISMIAGDNDFLRDSLMRLYEEAYSRLSQWAETFLALSNTPGNFFSELQRLLSGVYVGILSAIRIFKNLMIGLIVMIYVLNIKDILKAHFKKVIYSTMSIAHANRVIDEMRFVNKVFGGFIVGKLIDSLIIGILSYVVFRLMDMPYLILISLIIGVTNIIPFFGPFIGAVPSAILVLIDSPGKCIWFLLMILVIQQLDGNVIGPKVLGNSTGLSSFWVLFSIIFFGGLLGPLGMIIGVPTFAVIYHFIQLGVNGRLRNKHLQTNTANYTKLDHIKEDTGEFVEHQ